MSHSSFIGLDILRDLGVSYVEGFVTNLSKEDTVKIRQAFEDYLHERITYNACRHILLETVGRDDSLARVQDILNLPEEPIPYHEDRDVDDNSLTFRRKTRTWTPAEDQRLLGGVARFGLDNWQTVAKWLGSGRNRAQCSQRWTRGLDPRISKKSWTPEEDAQLEELVRIHGDKSWTKIASILGNRSDVQCRYHWRQLMNGYSEGDERREKRKSEPRCEWKEAPTPTQPIPGGVRYMPVSSARFFASMPSGLMQDPPVMPPLRKFGQPRARFGSILSDGESLDSFLSLFK